MALTDSLRILVTANGAQAEREFTQVGAAARKNLGQAETSAQRYGRGLTSAGVAAAAFGGIALVGLYKAAQAAEEEDLQIARLNNSMARSPALAGASTDAFLDQAASLQDITTFADDATIGVQALLGQFGLTQDEILQLTPLVLDLSSKMGVSLEAAAKAAGRATEGTAGGLQRMIGGIDEAGLEADAFGTVMDALSGKVGGFAEEEGAQFSGQMTIMKNNLGDIAEGVGRGAVDAFNDLLGPVTDVSDAFQKLSPEAQSTIGRILTFGAVGVTAAGGLSFFAGQVLTAKDRLDALRKTAAISKITDLIPAGTSGPLLAAIGLLGAGAVAISLFGDSSGLSEGQVNSLSESIARQNGIVGENSRAWLSNALVNGDLHGADTMIDVLDAMGLSVGDLNTKVAGSREEWAAFVDEMLAVAGEDLFPEPEVNRPGEHLEEQTSRLAHLEELRTGLEGLRSGYGEAAQTSSVFADGTAEAGDQAGLAADKVQRLNDRLDDYLDRFQAVEEAAAGEAEAQNAFFEALVQNGHGFDVNTEAGRANIAARNEWVDSVGEQIQAAAHQGEITGNTERAQRQMNEAIRAAVGDLRRARDAGLLTTEQFQALRTQVQGMPHHVNITVESNADFVRREFELLAGSISNAGAVAASHQHDFHMATEEAAPAAPARDGGAGGGLEPILAGNPAQGERAGARRPPQSNRPRPTPVYVIGGMR